MPKIREKLRGDAHLEETRPVWGSLSGSLSPLSLLSFFYLFLCLFVIQKGSLAFSEMHLLLLLLLLLLLMIRFLLKDEKLAAELDAWCEFG